MIHRQKPVGWNIMNAYKRYNCLFFLTAAFVTMAFLYIGGGYHSLRQWNSYRYHNSRKSFNELHNVNDTSVSIYFEDMAGLDAFYGNSYSSFVKSPKECVIPNGKCFFQGEHPKTDVVYKVTRIHSITNPVRYCERQISAVMHSEAINTISAPAREALNSANIKMDHHLTSDIVVTEACAIPWKKEMYTTPDPSKRKGVALFMSNCKAAWRSEYIRELSRHVHIDSYGRCFHNVDIPSDREHREQSFPELAKKYRMVVTFENTIENDYISEKIAQCYQAGVIPVYWGPPEIYLWAPGNHTFIDPQRFKGPKELAEYLKRVDEDDDLFRHHTTNFDFERTHKMWDKYCNYNTQLFCRVCKIAQDIKLARLKEGLHPPTC